MKRPGVVARRAIAVALLLAAAQAGSSSFHRFLRCKGKADDYALSEGVCRQRAGVCEGLSPQLREVAKLARELAKSASGDFERSRWLEMAHSEEEKAARSEREAVRLMARADELASRADALSRAAWRPWDAEPP